MAPRRADDVLVGRPAGARAVHPGRDAAVVAVAVPGRCPQRALGGTRTPASWLEPADVGATARWSRGLDRGRTARSTSRTTRRCPEAAGYVIARRRAPSRRSAGPGASANRVGRSVARPRVVRPGRRPGPDRRCAVLRAAAWRTRRLTAPVPGPHPVVPRPARTRGAGSTTATRSAPRTPRSSDPRSVIVSRTRGSCRSRSPVSTRSTPSAAYAGGDRRPASRSARR